MAIYNATVVTTLGDNLLAKIVAGEIQSDFTKIVTSSNQYPAGTDFKALTTLDGIEQTTFPNEISIIANDTVQVQGVFVNTGITTEYTVWNFGLYANDPDLGEILFSVTSSQDPADIMPPENETGAAIIADIIFQITNTTNITLVANPAGIATVDMLNNVKPGGWLLYENLAQLATTSDDIEFADLCSRMANKSIMRDYVASTTNTNLPRVNGKLTIVKFEDGNVAEITYRYAPAASTDVWGPEDREEMWIRHWRLTPMNGENLTPWWLLTDLDRVEALIDAASPDPASIMYLNLDQTVTGVKTFTTLPLLTNQPTTDNQAANKIYVDNAIAGNVPDLSGYVTLNTAQTISGVKTFTAAPVSNVAATTNTQLVRLQELNTQIATRAPTNHATAVETYGLGSAGNFGHVKLSDGISGSSTAAGGIAATPYAVSQCAKTAYSNTFTVGQTFAANVSFTGTSTTFNSNITQNSANTAYLPILTVNTVSGTYSSMSTAHYSPRVGLQSGASYIDFNASRGIEFGVSGNLNYRFLPTTGSIIVRCGIQPENLFDATYDIGAPTLRFKIVYASGGVVTSSDISKKKNISTIENATKWLRKTRPVEYEYTDIEGKRFGFIAQEQIDVFDKWGKKTENNQYNMIRKEKDETYGINYDEYVAILTQALKEQVDRADTLEAANLELKNKVEQLEARMSKIEQLLENGGLEYHGRQDH